MTDMLMEWKGDPNKKSLLIRGARQVGKTYIVDEFAKNNYRTYIYINFEEDESLKDVFAGDRSVDSVIRKLSLRFPDKDFIPGETLIFLDEIQNCPDARVAFKFFTIDGRYDVIGTGSLLGVKYKDVSSYPVGYESVIDMYSMDFEEFLWAMGIKIETIEEIKQAMGSCTPLDEFTLNELNRYYRWHMIIGGMPEAVSTFKETNHFGKVLNVQKRIVSGYADDISKYAPMSDKGKTRAVLYSIPRQLSRPNKKFVYEQVEGKTGSRHDTYGGGLSWLYDAGIISFCHNLQEPAIPLAVNIKLNAFKVYMRDTGLLISMMEDGMATALLNDSVYVNEGSIVENMTADMLAKCGYGLTYFERKGTLEVDFVLNLNGTATAIEVKSGNNRKSKSLDSIMSDKYKVKRGIKFENSNIYVDGKGVEHYPLFAAAFIRNIAEDSGQGEI